MIANPFTPTFGIVPLYLAGRESILETMERAFKRGLGDPNLCSILIGPRGSGKTALLTKISEVAITEGWIAVSCAAEDGMLQDILLHAQRAATHLLDSNYQNQITGVSVGGVGINWAEKDMPDTNWRLELEALLDVLKKNNTGLLITVDEVSADVGEMIKLASAYQLLIRDGHPVSLVMAGLPGKVDSLISDEQVSFLRRAKQHVLSNLSDTEVRRAFKQTVVGSGKTIEDGALSQMVSATKGFPYMMQLIGYSTWEYALKDDKIKVQHSKKGIGLAKEDFTAGVLEHTWREMSPGDKAFAKAMLDDLDGSTLSDVASRMGKGTNYASTYKNRLLALGVIGPRENNKFDFDIPLLREYIEEQL